MEQDKENSLMEILANCEMFPMSKTDLLRLVGTYGVDLNFHNDEASATISYDSNEYYFVKGTDHLYRCLK